MEEFKNLYEMTDKQKIIEIKKIFEQHKSTTMLISDENPNHKLTLENACKAACKLVDLCFDEVVKVLNSENTEGVSDASTESGVLHDVGESHASVENFKSDLASGEFPLEKITDYGNSIITLKCPEHPQCDCKDNCSRFKAENASVSND